MIERYASTFAHKGRGLSRWMELRAIGLSPELANWEDGVRAAVVVALPLAVLLVTGRSELGWAIFAAFWTCLADTGGALRHRMTLSAFFALPGAMVAFLASWLAGLGPLPSLVAGPVLVMACGLLPYVRPSASLVATLLAVVAVVAVGYPHDAMGAVTLAAMFLGGSLWAMVVILWVWRGDRTRPARQAVSIVFARLADMADDIAYGEAGEAYDSASHYSEHRRAVRAGLERAEGQLAGGQTDAAMPLRQALTAGDAVFHALLALDHRRSDDPAVRAGVAQIAECLADAARDVRRQGAAQPDGQVAVKAGLLRASVGEKGAFQAITAAFDAMVQPQAMSSQPQPQPSGPDKITPDAERLRGTAFHALRIGLVVAVVTVTAHALGLSYPYWATMAVIVVLHPVRRMSVARGVERILGSVAGGVLASLLFPWLDAPAVIALLVILGTTATMALRHVNYTIFVAFLSVLFVLVMHILHPAAGLASVRVLDNVVGSVAAILSVLVLSPRRGPTLAARIAEAVAANRAYLDAIDADSASQIAPARRAAGLASIEAEMAAHMPVRMFGAAISADEARGLAEARRLAGEAAAQWHARFVTEPTPELTR